MVKKILLSIMAALTLIGTDSLVGKAEAEKSHRTLPKTAEEKKILDVLDDMYRNQRRGMMNVSPEDGRLLRLLTEATGAQHVVEIGTSNGYSSDLVFSGAPYHRRQTNDP